jgi:hypothetical protein
MITAEDFDRARRAVDHSPWSSKVVWSGLFSGTTRGVLVVDAAQAMEVKNSLEDAGDCAIDGWWSSVSLTGLLPETAATR